MTAGVGLIECGERFVRALAQKDEAGLRAALARDVRFRALTPGQAWEADSQDAVIDILLGSWFEQTDQIEELVSHDVREVVDKIAIRYCLNVRNADGLFLVEQQGYLILADDGRIADAAIVCSGFRPIAGEK
jgi:hypothetical protein